MYSSIHSFFGQTFVAFLQGARLGDWQKVCTKGCYTLVYKIVLSVDTGYKTISSTGMVKVREEHF
jgi:hypothetical protein